MTTRPIAESTDRESLSASHVRQVAFAILVLAAMLISIYAAHASVGYGDDVVLAIAFVLAALGISYFWPTLDYRLADAPMAPLVAFVGCDGSGKSTITTGLHAELARTRRVEISYLGLGSGAMGERIKQLPLVGALLERKLARKATQTRTGGQKIPGLPTALVVYFFSLARLRRFKRMLRLRRAGAVVLTDRYPQIECPGFYDGPGLSAAAPGSWLVAALGRQERRLYQFMASFRPDVVVRLNVDAATAFARKPDHRPDLLQRKVEVTPLLRFSGAPIVDLDSAQPYDTVFAAASRIAVAAIGAAGQDHRATGVSAPRG